MRLSLLTAAFLFSIYCHAQNRIPGYIVTNPGDTVRGFIVDKNNDWRVTSIQFSLSESGDAKEYKLSDFKTLYFSTYDEYYFVETVDIDKKPIRMESLESAPGRRIVTETVLIKWIAGGKINLYYYKDETNKEHFLVKKDDKRIEELAFVKCYTPERSVASFPYYIQTLKSLTSDCQKTIVRNPDYELAPLKKLIDNYNSCFETKSYVVKKERVKFSMGVVVGGRYTHFKYEGTDYASQSQAPARVRGASDAAFGSLANAMAGLNFEGLSPRASNPFVPGLQIIWQETGKFEADGEKGFTNYRHYAIKYSFVTAAIYLKYYPLKQKGVPLYVKAAVGYNYLYHYDQEATLIDFNMDTSTKKEFMDFKTSGLNFSVGAGYTLRKLFLEINYQSDSMYGVDYATGKLSGVNLLVGYKIF